jgi:predicted transcriptional regulator
MRNTSRKAMYPLSLKVDEETLKRIDALAEQQERTRGWIVRRLLMRTLNIQAEPPRQAEAPVETTTAA